MVHEVDNTNPIVLLNSTFTITILSGIFRSLTLVTVLGIIFLFWVQNSEYHIGVKSQPKLVWKEKL